MTPSELDEKILAKLAGSPCILADLTERVGCSAKEILKRLHVLGAMKKVACEKLDGSLVWGLPGELAPKERPVRAEKPEPKRAAAPPAARGHLPDPEPRAATVVDQAPGESPAADFYRREAERLAREEECPNPWKVMVVRERTTIPEIRVTKLPREVVIAVVHEDPAKSEGVCIPRDPTVLAALIDALKQVMA